MLTGRRQRHLRCFPESLGHGWLADVIEQEQFTRSGHLAERLSRFGYTLPRIGGRGTTNNRFWSVR